MHPEIILLKSVLIISRDDDNDIGKFNFFYLQQVRILFRGQMIVVMLMVVNLLIFIASSTYLGQARERLTTFFRVCAKARWFIVEPT